MTGFPLQRRSLAEVEPPPPPPTSRYLQAAPRSLRQALDDQVDALLALPAGDPRRAQVLRHIDILEREVTKAQS